MKWSEVVRLNETLENYALFRFIEENKNCEKLSSKEAKAYYKFLKNNENWI